jgi:hypothetical protein
MLVAFRYRLYSSAAGEATNVKEPPVAMCGL